MSLQRLDLDDRQAVMYSEGSVCASTQELVESATFARVLGLYVDHLEAHNPQALDELGLPASGRDPRERLLDLFRLLTNNPLERVSITACAPGRPAGAARAAARVRRGPLRLLAPLGPFPRGARGGPARAGRQAPAARLHRGGRGARAAGPRAYRDVAENITGTRPRVLRQVAAGAEVGVYAVRHKWPVPARYRELLTGIPFVRDLLLYPPLLLDPPMNTRTGQFAEVEDNPLDGLKLEREDWLCYPAIVGRTTVFVYFHRRFMGLGLSLANLFEVASDEEIAAGPDAVYLYGVPPAALARFGDLPTVFHDDRRSRLLVAAVPLEDRFGYFGYLKKMVLTLHNVAAMDRGVMPFHGAYARLILDDGSRATVLLIGDTATGKSETLEALRVAGEDRIREVRIIADDMGSLEVGPGGELLGFGTEIGAFVRLDDLQQGYAFGQLDRSIIMSPNKVNARVVLPVTSLDDVLRGYPVDFLLYANNHEAVDAGHPVVDRLEDEQAALAVFRDGAAMSKGTTTLTGITNSYFANPFGPAQRRDQHEALAAADLRGGVQGRRVRRPAAHAAGAARPGVRRPRAPPPRPCST